MFLTNLFSESSFRKKTLPALYSSTAVLLLTACGGDGGEATSENQPPNSENRPQQNTSGNLTADRLQAANSGRLHKVSDVQNNDPFLSLAYNGYTAKASDYSNPKDLLLDLSATSLGNLHVFQQHAKDLKEKKETRDTAFKLPSGKVIDTGKTVVNPTHALGHPKLPDNLKEFAKKTKPTQTNAVVLSIASGGDLPETPAFPKDSMFSGVSIAPKIDKKEQTIVSIETSNQDVPRFGTFAARGGFTLRPYDVNDLAVDTTAPAKEDLPLLKRSPKPATIAARYLVLTGDLDKEGTGSGKGLNIKALTKTEFAELGLSPQATYAIFSDAFKGILLKPTQTQKEPLPNGKTVERIIEFERYFKADIGFMVLGGASSFGNLTLQDETYLYSTGTTGSTNVQTLTTDNTSGIITEVGNTVNIDTIQGSDKLNLLLVAAKSPRNDPIVKVNTLKGINKINVGIGRVQSGYDLTKLNNVVLLSHNGPTLPGKDVAKDTDATHFDGTFYDLSLDYSNNKVTVTSLKAKAKRLAAGITKRLLDKHPESQGITASAYKELAQKLNPNLHLDRNHLQPIAAASLSHLNKLIATQTSALNNNNLHITSSSLEKMTTASASVQHGPVVFSGFGVSDHNADNTSVGTNLALTTHLNFSGIAFTPMISVGHALDTAPNAMLRAQNIGIQLSDMRINSTYVQAALSTTNFNYDGLKVSGLAGVDIRKSSFSNGTLTADQRTLSLEGESSTAITTFLEASITSDHSSVLARVMNFNTFEVSFWFNN